MVLLSEEATFEFNLMDDPSWSPENLVSYTKNQWKERPPVWQIIALEGEISGSYASGTTGFDKIRGKWQNIQDDRRLAWLFSRVIIGLVGGLKITWGGRRERRKGQEWRASQGDPWSLTRLDAQI